LLDPALQADRQWPRRLRWAARLGLPLLVALVAGARQPLALAERLQLPHRQHRLLAQWLELRRRLVEQQLAGSPALPEHWCALLEASGCSPEAVALALACGSGPRRPLLRWLLRWRQVKAELTAADLLAAGMRQGPELGQRLRQLRAERLRLERI
ncbi:MAG: CCA tRNA nucleotidyltransferase, partial [Cyanobium sp. MAG_255]|nr:CCA tRNA nucleotidyltransferase [Cyanobium sp. MAG_255]